VRRNFADLRAPIAVIGVAVIGVAVIGVAVIGVAVIGVAVISVAVISVAVTSVAARGDEMVPGGLRRRRVVRVRSVA
jgi:hypothetical protein